MFTDQCDDVADLARVYYTLNIIAMFTLCVDELIYDMQENKLPEEAVHGIVEGCPLVVVLKSDIQSNSAQLFTCGAPACDLIGMNGEQAVALRLHQREVFVQTFRRLIAIYGVLSILVAMVSFALFT